MVICRFSPNLKWVRHFIADGVSQSFLTPIGSKDASLGISQMGVGVDKSGNLTCSFARDNNVNILNIDYENTHMALAYGKGSRTEYLHGSNL
jgi:hypothetical protein